MSVIERAPQITAIVERNRPVGGSAGRNDGYSEAPYHELPSVSLAITPIRYLPVTDVRYNYKIDDRKCQHSITGASPPIRCAR